MTKKNRKLALLEAVSNSADRLRRDLHRTHFEAISAQHRRLVARAYAILAVLDAVASVARPPRRGLSTWLWT